MEFDPEAVEVFTQDRSPFLKYRMIVGYTIDNKLFYMQKFGSVYLPTKEKPYVEGISEICRRTYDQIQVPGEIEIPLYAYDFGALCEFDDNGMPIGDWEPIGRMTIQYHEKFLMPGGDLPMRYAHLLPFRRPSWYNDVL
jgi:hypothetical protein